jgi:23S rRNA C2498 (ribose-2'-O)-methylase RlmM
MGSIPPPGGGHGYAFAYRLRITPWERYGKAAAASIGALLDREQAERSHPLGRAIDLGCGRGLYTHELVRRGWEAVGIDNVPCRSRPPWDAPVTFSEADLLSQT